MSIQECLLEPQIIPDDLDSQPVNRNIKYKRCNEFEVKIRGHHIELGTLEKTLLNYPHIKQVCVLAADNGTTKYLVVYYAADQEIDSDKFNAYLSLCLPEYMVPSYFVCMPALPLTDYGQVDRHALQRS